jgi:ribosomal protein S18 acetylase RimI-like enzyme
MIRCARVEDSRAIAEVHVASWQSTYAGQIPDEYLAGLCIPARETAWRASFSNETHRIFLSEEGGVVKGFVSFGPSRDNDASANTGEVYAIYLLAEYQGRGVGRALWQGAIEALKKHGSTDVTVWVLDTNSAARKFYEARGCSLDGASKNSVIGGNAVVELRYRAAVKTEA